MVSQETVTAILEMRKLFKTGDDKRDAGLNPQPDEVLRYDNLSSKRFWLSTDFIVLMPLLIFRLMFVIC